jgi:hypothetical protein
MARSLGEQAQGSPILVPRSLLGKADLRDRLAVIHANPVGAGHGSRGPVARTPSTPREQTTLGRRYALM